MSSGDINGARWLTWAEFEPMIPGLSESDVVLCYGHGCMSQITAQELCTASEHGNDSFIVLRSPEPARRILTPEQAALALLQGKVLSSERGLYRFTGDGRYQHMDHGGQWQTAAFRPGAPLSAAVWVHHG